MRIDRKYIKSKAIQSIHTSKPSPLFVSLVYCFIVFLLDYLRNRIIELDLDVQAVLSCIATQDYDGLITVLSNYSPSTFSIILIFVIEIVASIIFVGYLYYSMNVIRDFKANIGTIFDVFSILLKVIWLEILKFIFIFFWSLLLVVPGIIAIYKYRFSELIMFDNPNLSAYECIRESTRITKGFKSQMFILDLSFIGWYLLSSFPIIGYLINIYVLPYTIFTNCFFYETLRIEQQMPSFVGEYVNNNRNDR